MIAHVCERAQEAGAEEIVVATDDERIFQTVSDLGIKAVMTRPDIKAERRESLSRAAMRLGRQRNHRQPAR